MGHVDLDALSSFVWCSSHGHKLQQKNNPLKLVKIIMQARLHMTSYLGVMLASISTLWTNMSSLQLDNHVPFPDIGLLSSNVTEERNLNEDAYKEPGLVGDDEAFSESSHAHLLGTSEIDKPTSITKIKESASVVHVEIGQSSQELISTLPRENIYTSNSSSEDNVGRSNATADSRLLQ